MRATRLLTTTLAAAALLLALGAAPAVAKEDGNTCLALAMSGGGDKAAYEAGVLRGLVNSLPTADVAWQVVTGISAGSTLTAALSVFEPGFEPQAVDFIFSILQQLNQSSIFTQWPGGVVEGLTKHSSIFDSTPLRRLFTRVLAGRSVAHWRMSCMGASNLRTGVFERFCAHKDVEHVVNATLASAAIPGVFLSQQLVSEVTGQRETYVDGGTLVNVDVVGAIEQCLSLGYPQDKIIVDVVECSGVSMSPIPGGTDPSTLTTLPLLLRAAQMRDYSNSEKDFAAAQRAYPDVNYRYRIFPSKPIPGSGIDFNATAMAAMEALGEADAKAAVSGHAQRKPRPTPIALD